MKSETRFFKKQVHCTNKLGAVGAGVSVGVGGGGEEGGQEGVCWDLRHENKKEEPQKTLREELYNCQMCSHQINFKGLDLRLGRNPPICTLTLRLPRITQ